MRATNDLADVRTTRSEDLGAALTGTWIVLALFADGWAHQNVPELEGFFTPWHLALYSGLAAAVAWIALLARRRPGRGLASVPPDYRPAAVGAAVFAAGGLADMAWHLSLGVEVGIDALLSPPHLVLAAGGLLILSAPLRARWSAGDFGSPIALLALALPTALAGFFLLYVSEFAAASPTVPYVRLPEGAPGHEEGELPALAGLGAFLVTTGLFLVPLLLLWRRRAFPRAAVTVVVSVLAVLSAVVVGGGRPALAGAAGAVVGALAADAVLRRVVAASAPPKRLAVAAGATAALVWSGHLAGLALLGGGVVWPAELWSGIVVLSAAVAATLGHLAGEPTAADALTPRAPARPSSAAPLPRARTPRPPRPWERIPTRRST